MIQEGCILGTYSPDQSAAQINAVLKIDQYSYYLLVNQQEITSGKRSKLELDIRLGTLPRNILLENSLIFTSEQHHEIDKLLPESSKFKRLLFHFESKLFWAIFAAAFILLATVSFFTFGVPLLSHTIAHALPESTNKIISFKVFDILDHCVLDETELPAERQQKIREHFHSHLVHLENENIPWKLHFRRWNPEIANAAALPAGDIILTDAFVNLCENQYEMDAVIFHEMGHIAHRHSLQALIRSAFTTGLIVLISGDANLLVDSGIGIGALLNNLKNSRGHEIEADHYSYEKMLSAGMNPQHFSNILARLTNVSREDTEPMDSVTSPPSVNMETTKLDDYLSTHPNTMDRINLVKCYNQCFKKGLNKCEHNN